MSLFWTAVAFFVVFWVVLPIVGYALARSIWR